MEALIARSPKRGAVDTWHHAAFGNGSSRAFNQLEADPKFMKLGDELDTAVERARERISKKYLAYFRKRMKEHNVRHHLVTLSCAMGSCSVRIDGKSIDNFTNYPNRQFSVLLLLAEIEQAMSWEWASHLEGEALNVKEPK